MAHMWEHSVVKKTDIRHINEKKREWFYMQWKNTNEDLLWSELNEKKYQCPSSPPPKK